MARFDPICADMVAELKKTPKTELFRARIDRGRKAKVAKILRRYGLTPGEAVNVFFAKVAEVGGLPFDLRPDRPTETEELLADPEFQKHLARMRKGKVRYVSLEDVPE
jgi:addiction module RelB/DinJ family antitoxin